MTEPVRNNDGGVPVVTDPAGSPRELLKAFLSHGETVSEEIFSLDDDRELAAAAVRQGDEVRVRLATDLPGALLLHWGVALRSRFEWRSPARDWVPEGSEFHGEDAVQTPFGAENGHNVVDLAFPGDEGPLALVFVLKAASEDRWFKNNGADFRLSLRPRPQSAGAPPGLVERIVEPETGKNSWTLMHRYNLCHDLLDEARDSEEGMALLFVWLRFSALRQLTWQRHYNTKPRELAHAQDRLGRKLTEVFLEHPEHRETVRLMLGSTGRGGEGQKIRDEILHIMQRHNIKEVTGHFMEEWHQKLHNNTTPDDVVICRAYLEFLRSDGNLDRFYETLEADGVTAERLASFERPITSRPDFPPHLKDALIHDFENFLGLLRSIHSGNDLNSAIDRAQHLLDDGARESVHFIRERSADPGGDPAGFLDRLTHVRHRLAGLFQNADNPDAARDALYLDLGLEEALRKAVESNIHRDLGADLLLSLTGRVLENLCLSRELPELRLIAGEWGADAGSGDLSADRALRLLARVDRLRRAVSEDIDRWYRTLQPIARELGEAFEAEPWTIDLFAEAVVRGRPAFALSTLLHHLDPLLRSSAGGGGWQVISRGEARGLVRRVETLGEVQGSQFEEPTILIAGKVRGDEEPPSGAVAIVTADPVDLVSHVAVRARNAPILFATCHDEGALAELEDFAGRWLDLEFLASGEVRYAEAKAGRAGAGRKAKKKKARTGVKRPEMSHDPIPLTEFRPGKVGGKGLNLQRLTGKIPDWIHLPPSVALPFGTFEHVLETPANRSLREELAAARKSVETDPGKSLARIREIVLRLEAPGDFGEELVRVMTDAGLEAPGDWDSAWHCIKGVWASKWNDRAWFSRRAREIADDDVCMAVLIQKIVPAEYAFVLHTANPFTGAAGELYGEVAVGLGEAIVGNYPGRSLSFTTEKNEPDPQLLTYPSKSLGLFGEGLIYRSDSNAEDLAGYAGAGLYDSLAHPPAAERLLDYSHEPLVTDPEFRRELLTNLTRIGSEIEGAFGSPQDIEGACAGGRYFVLQSRPQV